MPMPRKPPMLTSGGLHGMLLLNYSHSNSITAHLHSSSFFMPMARATSSMASTTQRPKPRPRLFSCVATNGTSMYPGPVRMVAADSGLPFTCSHTPGMVCWS